jgi:hypothetical protein
VGGGSDVAGVSVYEFLVEFVLVGELVSAGVTVEVFGELLPLVLHDVIVGGGRTLPAAREGSH